jgi:hypothetical protein
MHAWGATHDVDIAPSSSSAPVLTHSFNTALLLTISSGISSCVPLCRANRTLESGTTVAMALRYLETNYSTAGINMQFYLGLEPVP